MSAEMMQGRGEAAPHVSSYVAAIVTQVLLTCVVYWLAFPGLLSSDSLTILEESHSWQFNSGHPPIMGLVWGLLNKVVDGPELMLLVQLLSWGTGISILAVHLFNWNWLRVLAVIAGIAAPMFLSNIGVLWKDIWCTSFIAIAAGCLARAWLRGVTVPLGIAILISLQISILFRPNAVGAAVAILAGLISIILLGKPWWPLIRRTVSFVLGIAMSAVLLLAGMLFDRTVGVGVPAAGLYWFDIAGVISNSPQKAQLARHIAAQYPLILRDPQEFVPMLDDSFIPYTAVSLNADWGNDRSPFVLPFTAKNLVQYQEARKYVIREDPVAYLSYRATYLKYLLGMYTTPGAGRNGWVLADLSLKRKAYAAAYVSRLENTWLFAPVVWLVFCVLPAVGLLLGKTREGAAPWIGLSAIGVTAVLYFVGPAPDYRYMNWVVLSGVMLALWIAQRAFCLYNERDTVA